MNEAPEAKSLGAEVLRPKFHRLPKPMLCDYNLGAFRIRTTLPRGSVMGF